VRKKTVKLARNVHQVFHEAPRGNDLLSTISLSAEEEAELRESRDKVRSALRVGLGDWSGVIRRQELFEHRTIAAGMRLPTSLRPKFRMQGSFAYRTINSPANVRHQQIDIDDGVFLPTSFVSDDGRRHPIVASRGYFTAVETILGPVCSNNGWRLVDDKPTCVRVELSRRAHLDLPLYAIPDEEFARLLEKAAFAMDARSADLAPDSVEFADAVYRDLREDEVMLAHRDEGWKQSDPRKIEDWFVAAVQDHGQQLRRVCRYLKGWRDHRWPKSPLSSIAIMRCVADAYDAIGGDVPKSRDDYALLLVAGRLPDLLSARIPNPVIDDQFLDEGWDATERSEIVSEARLLADVLKSVLTVPGDAADVLTRLVLAFGDRIPKDATLVRPQTEEARILAYKPAPVAKPSVPRTVSG
jgi:hypothetical protein